MQQVWVQTHLIPALGRQRGQTGLCELQTNPGNIVIQHKSFRPVRATQWDLVLKKVLEHFNALSISCVIPKPLRGPFLNSLCSCLPWTTTDNLLMITVTNVTSELRRWQPLLSEQIALIRRLRVETTRGELCRITVWWDHTASFSIPPTYARNSAFVEVEG